MTYSFISSTFVLLANGSLWCRVHSAHRYLLGGTISAQMSRLVAFEATPFGALLPLLFFASVDVLGFAGTPVCGPLPLRVAGLVVA